MAKSILLLGATGPAGIAVIRRAISDSITVLVYARTPSKLPADLLSHNLVKVLPGGTLDDVDSLHAAVAQKPDAIVSLLGPPPSETKTWMNPFAKDRASLPFADAYNVVVEAMKEHGVRRILVMGTLSIPDAKDHTSLGKAAMVWVVWLVMNRAYRNIVAVGNFFDTVSKEDVDWTIFRLGLVADGAFESVTDGYVADGKTTLVVKREELADWLVKQATSEVAEWAGEKPVVSTAGKQKI